MLVYFFLDVSSICQFHHNAQTLGGLIKECFFIVDDVGMGNGGQNSDFVESVISFLNSHLAYFDLAKDRVTFFMAYIFLSSIL